MPYRRGDVVVVIWPNVDRKTYKQRPALIVQADNLNTGLRTRLCAIITTTPRTGDTCIQVAQRSVAGQQMSLQGDSVIMTDQLLVVPEPEIKKAIGRCTIMAQVDATLRKTLAL